MSDSDDQKTENEKLKRKLKDEAKKYKTEISKLNDEIDQKDDEIVDLKKKLKKAKKSKKENSDNETSLDNVAIELQKIKEELNSTREKLRSKIDIISQKDEFINSVKNLAIQRMIKKIDLKDVENAELNKTLLQNLADLNVYRKALQVEKNENNLDQKLKRMNDEIDDIKAWRISLSINQEKNDKHGQSEILKTECVKRNKRIQCDILESNESIDEKDKVIEALKEQIGKGLIETNKLTTTVVQQVVDLNGLKSALKAEKEKYINLNAISNEQQEKIKTYEMKIKTLEDEMNKIVKDKDEQLKKKQEIIEKLQTIIQNHKIEIEKLKQFTKVKRRQTQLYVKWYPNWWNKHIAFDEKYCKQENYQYY